MANHISPTRVKHVRDLAQQGFRTKEIARQVGLSESSVHKIRQGRYRRGQAGQRGEPRPDVGPLVVWCDRCRCHVYAPCQTCRLCDYQRRPHNHRRRGPIPPLPRGISDAAVLRRLRLSVAEIGLAVRTVNYLQQRNIATVNDLLHCTPAELLRIPNFAVKTLKEIYRALAKLGFHRQA